MRLQFRTYERIRIQVESRQSLTSNSTSSDTTKVTVEKFVTMQHRWTYTTSRTRVWLWKLDNSLPGRVGQIGDWLYRAEEKVTELYASDLSTMTPTAAAHTLQEHLHELDVSSTSKPSFQFLGDMSCLH